MIEKFEDMREDLARERRFMGKSVVEERGADPGVVGSTVGMVGNLQGIAGKAMHEIPSLDMPLLEASPLSGVVPSLDSHVRRFRYP